MKILLIEDTPEIAEIVSMTLRARWPEASLDSTSSGEEGIRLVRQENPDIVLLDLTLPDIDGFQVLREIRSFSDALIVILTGREEENRNRCLREGANDFVIKPFSPKQLVIRLKSLVQQKPPSG
jgi:two-component system, OmpR family, response regulator VicR